MTAAPVCAARRESRFRRRPGCRRNPRTRRFQRSILVDQNAHGLVGTQGLQNAARKVLLLDQVVPGHSAPAIHQRVDQRIVERAHHHVHGCGRAGRERTRSAPSCPGARWRRARPFHAGARAQNARSLRSESTGRCWRDPYAGKRAKVYEQARDGTEHAVNNTHMLVPAQSRKRHGQIGKCYAAQPRQRQVEQPCVASGQPMGDNGWRVGERA